jgi:peptidoglycan/LPS O-acetylase OafA/YrhL
MVAAMRLAAKSPDDMHGRLRVNNFDAVRLVLAMVVCLVHAAVLSLAAPLQWIHHVLSSRAAVESFFIVSGFLVFMSYDRSSSLASFASKRVRRLYPAYVTIVLLCAFGLVFMSATPGAYFGHGWLRYMATNLVFMNFLQPTLPGVFAGNPAPEINGALWSLKIEVSFYIAVPLIAALFRFGRARVLVGTYAISTVWALAFAHLAAGGNPLYSEVGRQLPGALRFFVVGAAAYYYLQFFERHIRPLLAGAVLVLLVNAVVPLVPLYPAALGTVVCFCALFGYLGNAGRYGDLSYGLYIVHFPILQILVATGLFSSAPWAALVIGVSAALAGAAIMWHLVEKRFLARSSHYVRANVNGVAVGAEKS